MDCLLKVVFLEIWYFIFLFRYSNQVGTTTRLINSSIEVKFSKPSDSLDGCALSKLALYSSFWKSSVIELYFLSIVIPILLFITDFLIFWITMSELIKLNPFWREPASTDPEGVKSTCCKFKSAASKLSGSCFSSSIKLNYESCVIIGPP